MSIYTGSIHDCWLTHCCDSLDMAADKPIVQQFLKDKWVVDFVIYLVC